MASANIWSHVLRLGPRTGRKSCVYFSLEQRGHKNSGVQSVFYPKPKRNEPRNLHPKICYFCVQITSQSISEREVHMNCPWSYLKYFNPDMRFGFTFWVTLIWSTQSFSLFFFSFFPPQPLLFPFTPFLYHIAHASLLKHPISRFSFLARFL